MLGSGQALRGGHVRPLEVLREGERPGSLQEGPRAGLPEEDPRLGAGHLRRQEACRLRGLLLGG
eukprot:2280319-Alexandrium_andersonii.AAC.1